MRIAVIGAGSWGTATAGLLAKKGHDVRLWALEKEVAAGINEKHRNPMYLSDMPLPKDLNATNDMAEALADADAAVMVVVSHAMREVIEKAKPHMGRETIIVSQTKGVENVSFMRMTEVIEDVLGSAARRRLAVLSGPNHAEEVGKEVPSATVIAAYDREVAKTLQEAYMTPYFRVYTNPDLIGVEIAGATKNVVALATGMSDGLGFGDNSKASLLTRGLAEMTRLGTALGAHPLTFSGLAGVGDLVVTCFSQHSRNRLVGERLAKGQTIDEIYADIHMIAEGVQTSRAVRGLAEKYGVSMPIAEHVYEVLYEKRLPLDCLKDLMSRAAREESEELATPVT
ncbi:MAG: NAD(P)H-dependent glycerol-3-phosphate dehydrogenase [Actinomycetota bacterium]